MLIKSWNYTFSSLNAFLGALAIFSVYYRSLSYLSITVSIIFLVAWLISKSKNGKTYKNATKNGWIEAEIAIYSSFAVWISIYVSLIPAEHQSERVESVFSNIALLGGFGWILSLIPWTSVVKKLR